MHEIKNSCINKGISSVVAAVIIATISVTLVGTTYFFSQSLLKGTTAETFEFIDVFSNMIIVRNLGTNPINNFTVLVDGKQIDARIKEPPVEPGKIGTVVLNLTDAPAGRHELVIMSKSMSQRWTWEFQYVSETTTTTTIVETTTPAPETTTTLPVGEAGTKSSIESVSETEQGSAEIGKPVKWKSRIQLKNPSPVDIENYPISSFLPRDANDVVVKTKWWIFSREIGTMVNVAGFGSVSLSVEYQTPVPYKEETVNTTEVWKKSVKVKSDASVHYKNVKVYSKVSEDIINPRIYFVENNTRKDITSDPYYKVSFVDTDGNGKVDTIFWVVPELSEKLFDIMGGSTWLDVNLLTPNPSECNETSPCSWKQYTNNWVNASVTCYGGDCGTVQGLARYKISNTYDFKGITNPSSAHWAGYNKTDDFGNIPIPDNYTQASTANYQNISSSDGNYWLYTVIWKSTGAPVQMFKFKLNESLSEIEKIFILWEGYGTGSVQSSYLYLWNLSSSSWGVYINSTPLDAEGEYNLTYILNSSFSDFVDSSNYIRIAAKGPNSAHGGQINGELYTDYVKVDVSSWKTINTTVGATPFYTTDLNPKSCGSLSNGQTRKLNWTINTTGEINSINVIDVKFNSSASGVLDNDTDNAFIDITWFNDPPQWSQMTTSPPSDSFYQTGRNYGFQIKWTDPELGVTGISSVIFEWSNGTTKYNYTKYTTPSVSNDTTGIYWFNLTDLPAGNYNFTWYANDTSNIWATSDRWPYVINKLPAPIHLFLNGTEMDKEYANNTAANFTVTLDVPGKNVSLNTNITGWVIQSNPTPLYNITILTASVYGTKYNITGYFLGNQNYSANSTTYYAVVQNPIQVYGWLNVTMLNPNPSIYNTTNPKTVLQNDNFNINATVRCEGVTGAVCGNVMGSARYDGNLISTVLNSKPFYILIFGAKTDTIYPNGTNNAWRNLASTKVGAASDTDTEFITSEYNNIQSSNDNWVNQSSTSTDYGGLHFSFGLGNYQNINKIKFTFEGYVTYYTGIEGSGNTSGSLYMYTDDVWDYVGDCGSFEGDQNCTIEINSNIDHYLDNNNKFHFGFAAPWKLNTGIFDTKVMGDFVKLEVTYGGTQNPSPCGPLSLGQTCQLNWTINATGLESNPNIWNIDVNASSDKKPYGVGDNNTDDAIVKINETKNPRWIENTNSTSSTYAGTPTKFILKWIDNFALSGYMLSLDNCTGSFKNESWSNSGWESYPSEGWSNVTRIINSTTDCTIRWRYFANDTSNNWNVSQNFSFNTTGVVPWLNVTLLTPNPSECSEGSPCSWRLYNTYKINAIVECKDEDCGDVNGTVRYNTTDGMVPINTTEEATPFYASYSFNDSFEGNAVGSNPLDWEIMEWENGSVNVVDTLFANGLKSVELNDTDPTYQGKVIMKKNIPGLKNGIWEWYVNVNQTDPYILMFLGSAVEIHLYSGGEIKAFNGSNEQTIGTYSNNKWYKFKVKFDSKTQKFSIWINDSLNASNFDFKIYSEYVDSIQYWGTISSGIAKFYVDEVKIEGLLANNTQLCGNMKKNQLCQLEWIVNATGTTDSVYKIGVLFNSSNPSVKQNHTNNATVKIAGGNLEVNLIYPPITTTNVDQNNVFNVNATVTCRNAPCGNVYGTVRYNASSANPDTNINKTKGDKPFYISEPKTFKIYNFSGITKPSSTHRADYGTGNPANPDVPGTEELSSYSKLSTSDDDWWWTISPGGKHYQRFRFKVNESSSTINNLTVLWEGHGTIQIDNGYWYGAADLYIWNFGISDWELVKDYLSYPADGIDRTLSKNYTSNINNYVNASGYVFLYVGVKPIYTVTYSYIYSDFVKVEIDATLNPNSCSSLNKDQSCQLNWTVNATGDLWREYKVGVLFNSSYSTITPNHTNNATIRIKRTFLEVNLTYPPIGTTNVYQNNIFTVNASVTCRYGNCGDVNGTVGYNDSSVTPDTPITVTNGATPFYIISALVRPIGYDGIFVMPATNAYDDGFNDSLTDAVVFNNNRGNYTYYFGPSTSAIIFARAAGSTDTGEKIQVYNFTGGTWYDISGELGEARATFSTKVNKSSGLINSTGHAILSMVADYYCYVQLTDTYASFNSNTVYCDGLKENKNCNLTWIVNATGTIDSVYKIGVLFNSSNPSVKQNHTNNATVRISGGNLEVNLTYPPIGTTNVYQNNVFNVNATVNCRNAPCGNVYGTVRYNASSANPDTTISTTKGDTPFYITEPMWTNKLYNANRSFRNNSAITRGISGYNGMTLNEYINWINNSVKTEVSDLNLTGSQNINYSLTISPAVSYIKLSFALATTQDYYRNWEYAMYNLSIYNYSSASWSSVENRTVTFLGQYSIKEASCRVSNFTIPITSHVKQGNIVNISLYMFEKDYSEHNAGMGPLDVYCDGEHVTFLYFYTAFVWSRLYEGYNNTIPCDSLSKDQSCQLNWTVNTTGDLGKGYKIGVLFNSSYSSVKQNHTNNATVKIKMMRELNVTSVNFNDTSFYIYDPIECAGNVIDESHDVTHVYYKIWDHLSSENNPNYSGELNLVNDCVGSSWANGKNCKKIVSSIVGLKGDWHCSIIANDGGNNVTGYAPTATMLNTEPPKPVITQPVNNSWFNKYQNPIHITCTNTTPDENIEDSLKFDTIWCCDDIGRDRYACNDNVDTDCVWNLDGNPKVNDNESIRIYCQANDSSDPSDYSDIKIVKLDRTSPNCTLNITNITINPYLLKGNYWDALSGMSNVTYWFNNGTWNNIGTNTTANDPIANYTWYWNVSNVTPSLEDKWIYVKATCNDTAGNDNTSQTYVAVDLNNIIPSIWNLKVRDDIDDPINESWSDRMVNITVNVSDPDPVWGINYIGLNFTDLFKGNNYYGNFSLAELGHDYNYYLNFTIKYYYGPGPVWINTIVLDNNGSSSKTTTSNFTILKTKNFGLENYPIDFNRSKPLQFVNATMNRGWPLKIYSRSNWPMNFSQNGTNLTGIQDNAFLIRISKVLWNLTDSGTFSPFKEGTPSSIINNVGVGENVSVYYKLDVPLTKPQNYSGEITIEGLLV